MAGQEFGYVVGGRYGFEPAIYQRSQLAAPGIVAGGC
jgi:hypothetical protein